MRAGQSNQTSRYWNSAPDFRHILPSCTKISAVEKFANVVIKHLRQLLLQAACTAGGLPREHGKNIHVLISELTALIQDMAVLQRS